MRSRTTIVLNLILLLAALSAFGQGVSRVPDPNFDSKVAQPAYTEKQSKVLFDAAHFNENISSGNYKRLVDLMRNDGYTVNLNNERFSTKVLEGYNVLIIVNAAAGKGLERYYTPAFNEEECQAIHDWVKSGGSLLLIAGGNPHGKGAENLAKRFGIEMSNGKVTDMKPVSDFNLFSINFTKENKFLLDHPITQGRNSAERISRVVTYVGQSLKGPEGSAALLKLSDAAVETPGITKADIEAARANLAANNPAGNGLSTGSLSVSQKDKNDVSVAGRAQAIALSFGKGRVVVSGDSDMFSAQLLQGQVARAQGKESIPLGMNVPGNDNRQFALNAMHWLSGLLPPK